MSYVDPTDKIALFWKSHKFLILTILLFVVVFSFRLYHSLNNPHFSSESSYLNLRYAKDISENGILLYDNLSFSGRSVFFNSLMNYILSFFGKFFGLINTAKVMNELFFSSILILIFFICKELFRNPRSSFYASLVSISIPFIYKKTFNVFEPSIFGMFFIFLLFYLMLRMRRNKNLSFLYVIVLLFSLAVSPVILLFTISLIVLYVLSLVFEFKLEKYEKEIIVFSFFVSLIVELIMLKDILLISGFSTIRGNVPINIQNIIFPQLSLAYTAYLLGIITVIFAFRTVYINFIRTKNPSFFIIFSMALSTFTFLWLRIIQFDTGVLFIALLLPILTGYFFMDLENYLKTTKFEKYSIKIISFFLIILLFSNIFPSINEILTPNKIIDENDVSALEWLKYNSRENEVVYCDFYYGNIVSFFSGLKVVADTQFLGIPKSDIILKDMVSIKTSMVKTNIIGILNKYKVTYIVLNKDLDTKIFDDRKFSDSCFEEIYNNDKIRIMKVKCQLS